MVTWAGVEDRRRVIVAGWLTLLYILVVVLLVGFFRQLDDPRAHHVAAPCNTETIGSAR